MRPPPPPTPLHRVKPAIFDLLLAVCIAAYLGMMYLAIQVSHCNAVGCSPLKTRMALHKHVSEYLRILIDAAAESVPVGLPSAMKPLSDTSIRVGSSLSCCFRTTCVRVTRLHKLACSETGTAVSLCRRFSLVSKLHTGKSHTDVNAGSPVAHLVSQQLFCRAKNHQQNHIPGGCR